MLGKKQRDLRQLIQMFRDALGEELISDLNSYVDHREPALAIETLSDWIYEEDIPVSADQKEALLKSSADFDVDTDRHAFIGRKPPYPDLRTPEQIAKCESMSPNNR